MCGRLFSFAFLVGLLAVSATAQSQDNPPPQDTTPTPPAASSTTAPVSPKKVWTNENLASAKGDVSVVGDKRNQSYHLGSGQPADPATAARIKKDLEKLQSQLDDVNSKLKSYKEFQDGEPVSKGERDLSKGYSRTPVDQQMEKLLKKKKELQTQIGDLVDEARKKGIDPGQLR
jgi:hypothetical protein